MRRDLLIALVLLALGLGQNLSRVDDTAFHRDEARWTHRAGYVRELADPLGPYWRDRKLMRAQAPLGAYLTGLALVIQGQDLETNGLWSSLHGDAWNQRHGRMPEPADLRAARRVNAILGAATAVVVFFVARRLANRVAGVAAALLLILHPLHVELSSLAGADALLGLLIALAALTAYRLADRPTWPRALLLGLLLGLGGATKLSPLLVAVPLAGVGALLLRPLPGSVALDATARQARRHLGWRLLAVPLVAFVVFVASYPYLWPDPVGRTPDLFTTGFRSQELETLPRGARPQSIDTRTQAVRQVRLTLGQHLTTSGRIGDELDEALGLPRPPRGLDLVLGVAGAALLAALSARRGPRSPHALVGILLGAQAVVVVAAMRFAQTRSTLPILLGAAICAGLLIGRAWAGRQTAVTWLRNPRGLLDRVVSPGRPAMTAEPWLALGPAPGPGNGRRDLAFALLLGAVALGHNLGHLDVTPFHPDETRWLNRAHYIQDVLDPFGPTWDDHYLTHGQPPLGSYLTGIALLAQGQDLETNGVWDFRRSQRWNTFRGNMASDADLDAGRRMSALVGALTVVAVYFLAKRLGNRVAGIVAALFLAIHPLHVYLSTQIRSDGLLVLLVAVAVLAACRLVDRPTWPRALLLGAVLGLGGATKLSPLLVTLPVAGIGALLLVRHRLRWLRFVTAGEANDRALGAKLLAVPLAAYVVFVASYPYLWHDPIGRTIRLFEFRAQEMDQQGVNLEGVEVTSRADALRRIGVWLAGRFAASGWLDDAFGIGWPTAGLDLALAVIGAEILLALAVMRGLRSPHALATTVLAAQVGITLLALRADFARYHLPTLLVIAVCLGLLASHTVAELGDVRRGIRRRLAARMSRQARQADAGLGPALPAGGGLPPRGDTPTGSLPAPTQ